MTNNQLHITEDKVFDDQQVLDLYKALNWSSGKKPDQLLPALRNSHSLVQVYYKDQLVGLGNAISDGYLVVYYAHLLVHPEFQGQGVGRMIMERMASKYGGFHQQMIVADRDSVAFYQKCGFVRAGNTVPVWIYGGEEH